MLPQQWTPPRSGFVQPDIQPGLRKSAEPVNFTLERSVLPMHLHAKRVSAIASGDYFQVHFDSDERNEDEVDPFAPPAPYVMVQCQFEFFSGGKCHVESDDEEYIGDFKLNLVEFSSTRFVFEIPEHEHKLIEVSFALTERDFVNARRIVEVIFGIREPFYEEGNPHEAL